MTQLADLAKPFPKEWVKTKPGRGNAEYVEHSVITQRLLEVVGPFNFEVTQVVQQDGDTWCVLARLSCHVDGQPVTIVEGGQSDNKMDPFKSAISDALKRCAMRLGLGLHLWAQENYYLDKKLPSSSEPAPPSGSEDGASGSRSVSTPASSGSDAPPTSEPGGGDGEVSPPGEEAPDPPLPIADQAMLHSRFMGIVHGANCKLDYERDVRPFLHAHYEGRGWSDLTAGEKQKLVNVLTKGNSVAEKTASQEAFAKKVRDWQKEAAA